MTSYTTYQIDWDGLAVLIRWTPDWHNQEIGHMEFISDDRAPMPVSETGYRSHFVFSEFVEDNGGPAAYALQMLDFEAAEAGWHEKECERRQLSLF